MLQWSDIDGLPCQQAIVGDYPNIIEFLGLFVPELQDKVLSLPVRMYEIDIWRSIPWTERKYQNAPIACVQRFETPLIMIRDEINTGAQADFVRSYNVMHEILHLLLSEGLYRDYRNSPQMSELATMLPDYQQDYCIIHTMPLFDMVQCGSRSAEVLDRVATCVIERGWKSSMLAHRLGVHRDNITNQQLLDFSREIIQRAIDISHSNDNLGRRFANVFNAVPDADCPEIDECFGSSCWLQ